MPILGASLQFHWQRTLDEDCRQAEEPKQLADEASRFHLGRQRQHSAVIKHPVAYFYWNTVYISYCRVVHPFCCRSEINSHSNSGPGCWVATVNSDVSWQWLATPPTEDTKLFMLVYANRPWSAHTAKLSPEAEVWQPVGVAGQCTATHNLG